MDEISTIRIFENGVEVIEIPKTYFVSTKAWNNASTLIMENGKLVQRHGLKTLWPSRYTSDTILESIVAIVEKPENFVKINKRGHLEFSGIDGNGVRVRAVLDGQTKLPKTAFPEAIQ